MALTVRKRIGQAELDRVAEAAGYANDVPGYIDALEDMATGLQEACQARRRGTNNQGNSIDEWGFAAHLKNYSVALSKLMQSSGW